VKKLIWIVALSFEANCTFAQRYYTNESAGSIMFVAGFNSSRLLTDTADNPGLKTPLAGLMYSYYPKGQFNISIGAIYAAKGYKQEKLHESHRYFYVDIPLYVQYKLSDDIRFDLGGQCSLFTASATSYLDGSSQQGAKTVWGSQSLIKNDLGIVGGVDIKLGDNFDLTAHYSRSFAAFQNKTGFDSFELHLHFYMVKFYQHGSKKEEPMQETK
jgi:hypothetical protein